MKSVKYISNTFRPFVILGILCLALSCAESVPEPSPQAQSTQAVEVCDKNEIQHEKLLSAKQAHALLNTPDYIFIEISKKSEYNKGHISNALHRWRPDFRSKKNTSVTGMRCAPKEFLGFLKNLGIDKKSTLIIYDAKGGCDALRLGWVLDYYGFQKYKIINGGKMAWTLAGYPLDSEKVIVDANTDYVFDVKQNESILARHMEVLSAIRDTQTIIIDTREAYEYEGQCFVHQGKVLPHKKGAFGRGCIPTAIHLNWSDLSDLTKDHRIKCSKDLKYNLAQKGITKDKNIIVYCQSGSRSSHTAFVLKEILDYPNVKNYDGSWIEWSYLANQKETPVKKHTSTEEFELEMQRLTASLDKK